MLNLWNPTQGLAWPTALLTAFLLGGLHGITPDEHTWPITFSYAVGSYSSRGGAKAGFLFSLAFTLQRAIASQLAYFALVGLLFRTSVQNWLYVIVGAVMVASGAYILRLGKYVRLLGFLEHFHHEDSDEVRSVPPGMALVHGFVAGWGTGAFALIVYTVLAPTMPRAVLGFLPGLFFGLGTMVTQILIGAGLGRWMERQRLGPAARTFVGRAVSGRTLFFGGLAFVLAGLVSLRYPVVNTWVLATHLKVHNLHSLGLGFFLVVFILLVVGLSSFIWALRRVSRQTGAASTR